MRTFADTLTEIANLAGIQASPARLCQPFAQEGYCRRVAQVRPYPSAEAKKKLVHWAHHYADWACTDWANLIAIINSPNFF